MKRFLKSVFAALRKTKETKSVEASKRPSPTPTLEVRSQVKAGIVIQGGVQGGARS
jgi:hypothetical protein